MRLIREANMGSKAHRDATHKTCTKCGETKRWIASSFSRGSGAVVGVSNAREPTTIRRLRSTAFGRGPPDAYYAKQVEERKGS